MSNSFNINWSDVMILFGTMGVSAITLMVIFEAMMALDAWSKQLRAWLSTRSSCKSLRREMQSKARAGPSSMNSIYPQVS